MKARIAKYFSSHSPEIQGIFWMLSACFWFALMAAMIRYTSEDMNTMEMVFFRNFSAVLIMTPWVMRHGLGDLKKKRWNLYGYRSLSGIIGMFTFFYGIATMPLPVSISLTFLTPLITALLAIIFLNEKVGAHRWMAMIIGFSGAMVILDPHLSALPPGIIAILITTLCWSISNILIKKLTISDSPKVLIFITMFIMTIMAAPFAIMAGRIPTLEQLGLQFVLGWLTLQGQYCATHAYTKADMSVVMPFDFFRLIFVTILAYFIFDEILSMRTAIGAAIIFASSVYITQHTRRMQLKTAIAAVPTRNV